MKDPTKSANAVLDPRLIAPKAQHNTVERIMAGMGQLSLRFTWAKNGENGTALSRARDHHIRESYKILEVIRLEEFWYGETYGQKCANEANEDGAENDEEEAERCALAASSLSVYCSKRESTVA